GGRGRQRDGRRRDEDGEHGRGDRGEPREGAAPPRAGDGRFGDAHTHGGREVRRRRPGDLVAKGGEPGFESGLVHARNTSSASRRSTSSRSRPSARESRDLTVPRRTPSAA